MLRTLVASKLASRGIVLGDKLGAGGYGIVYNAASSTKKYGDTALLAVKVDKRIRTGSISPEELTEVAVGRAINSHAISSPYLVPFLDIMEEDVTHADLDELINARLLQLRGSNNSGDKTNVDEQEDFDDYIATDPIASELLQLRDSSERHYFIAIVMPRADDNLHSYLYRHPLNLRELEEHTGTAQARAELERKLAAEVAKRIRFAAQIACGLQSLHRVGAIHGDLKPGNVLIFGDTIRLSDYGLVQWLAGAHGLRDATSLYTLDWRAIEYIAQITNEPSIAADLWACGVTYQQLLFGGLDFKPDDQLDSNSSVINTDVAMVNMIRRRVAPFTPRFLNMFREARYAAEAVPGSSPRKLERIATMESIANNLVEVAEQPAMVPADRDALAQWFFALTLRSRATFNGLEKLCTMTVLRDLCQLVHGLLRIEPQERRLATKVFAQSTIDKLERAHFARDAIAAFDTYLDQRYARFIAEQDSITAAFRGEVDSILSLSTAMHAVKTADDNKGAASSSLALSSSTPASSPATMKPTITTIAARGPTALAAPTTMMRPISPRGGWSNNRFVKRDAFSSAIMHTRPTRKQTESRTTIAGESGPGASRLSSYLPRANFLLQKQQQERKEEEKEEKETTKTNNINNSGLDDDDEDEIERYNAIESNVLAAKHQTEQALKSCRVAVADAVSRHTLPSTALPTRRHLAVCFDEPPPPQRTFGTRPALSSLKATVPATQGVAYALATKCLQEGTAGRILPPHPRRLLSSGDGKSEEVLQDDTSYDLEVADREREFCDRVAGRLASKITQEKTYGGTLLSSRYMVPGSLVRLGERELLRNVSYNPLAISGVLSSASED